MEMPKVNENHKRLEKALVGNWVGDETIHPTPWDQKGGKAKGKFELKSALDGFWLIGEYAQEREGKVTYRGHAVYGWDGKNNTYTMYWFDTMGMDPQGPARGRFEGNTLIFEMSHDMGHSRYMYKFIDDKTHEFRIEQSQDKKSWKPFIESTWIKR